MESSYHYFATYGIARQAGFTDEEARFLAWRCQELDQGATSPYLPWNHWSHHFISEEEALDHFQAARTEWQRYAAVIKGRSFDSLGDENRVRKERLLTALAHAIHDLADAVAHRGYPKFFGHLFSGADPDRCDLHPDRCHEATRLVLSALAATCIHAEESGGSVWDWFYADRSFEEAARDPARREGALVALKAVWGLEEGVATYFAQASFSESSSPMTDAPKGSQPILTAHLLP